MIRPVTTLDDLKAPRAPSLFVLFEVLLLLAVPFLGYVGVQTLLDTRAGNYVEQPGPADPGWLADVAASPVTGIVEVLDGRVTGVSIVTQQSPSQSGGAVILVWPTTRVGGVLIGEMDPTAVVPALEEALNVRIPAVEILNEERWLEVLGTQKLEFDNPDPVTATDGAVLLKVGAIEVGADLASIFIGLPTDEANQDAIIVRRTLWWETLLASPPTGEDELAILFQSLGAGYFTIVDLPKVVVPGTSVWAIDREASETLIREFVPFLAGVGEEGRLQVRLLTSTRGLDLEEHARLLGRDGFEVVQIGNATIFDDGPNRLEVPLGVTDERVDMLARIYDADIVRQVETAEFAETVTLIVSGSDAEMSAP